LKKDFGDELVVMSDLCLCEYTSHGHCGVHKNGEILNDPTLEILQKVAVSQSQAGADVVAPSGMMDGQVKAIRAALDDAGFNQIAIMAYSAKSASCFYGPFRDAAECAPQFGDRKSYQMGFGNTEEALREIELDVNEGADIIMIKPALAYLDIIHAARSRFNLPIAAYNVSGEYSMVKAAAQKGWIDEKAAIIEILTGIKRAGADLIITYFAKDIGAWLKK
jgi:porphobilinogen synthase